MPLVVGLGKSAAISAIESISLSFDRGIRA